MANVVFDFDGTLADTFPLIVDVAYRLGRTKRLPADDIAGLRKKPLVTAVRSLGIAHWKMPLVIAFSRRRMTSRMQEVEPYNGVLQTLRRLKPKHRFFILTSNYKENVETFLRHHEAEELFDDVMTVPYANSWFKTRALKKLIKQYGLSPRETYHVGNEALDMHAARRVGIRGVAATWGGFDDRLLKATKPYATIDSPIELTKLLAKNR